MHRSISIQFYPDDYNLVEPQPVLVSEGYSSHHAGTQGNEAAREVVSGQGWQRASENLVR